MQAIAFLELLASRMQLEPENGLNTLEVAGFLKAVKI